MEVAVVKTFNAPVPVIHNSDVVALPDMARVVVVAWVTARLVADTGPNTAAMLVASRLPPLKVRPCDEASPPPDTLKPPLGNEEVAVFNTENTFATYNSVVVARPVAERLVEVAWVAVRLVTVVGPRIEAMLVASRLPPVRVSP